MALATYNKSHSRARLEINNVMVTQWWPGVIFLGDSFGTCTKHPHCIYITASVLDQFMLFVIQMKMVHIKRQLHPSQVLLAITWFRKHFTKSSSLKFPSRSTDLNPIQQLWYIIYFKIMCPSKPSAS